MILWNIGHKPVHFRLIMYLLVLILLPKTKKAASYKLAACLLRETRDDLPW